MGRINNGGFLMIDKHKHIPLYIQLKDELIQKIKDEVWEIDSKISTEKELMKEYGLGRATIREALSILVNEGYLYKKQGIGTFVARKQSSLGFEPLISLSYPLKIRGISTDNIIEEKKEIIPDAKLRSKLKWKKAKPCFYLKRMRYAENIPVAIESSYFNGGFKDIESKYDLTGSLAKILLEDLNITIKKVEQVIVPRVPTEEEKQKLKTDENVMVLDLERWIYIEGMEEPFYYLKFIIPGNIYTYAM